MKRYIHIDRHGVVHIAHFLGEQYVLGGQTKAAVYSTFCGDKLFEAEVIKEGRPTCLACIGQE